MPSEYYAKNRERIKRRSHEQYLKIKSNPILYKKYKESAKKYKNSHYCEYSRNYFLKNKERLYEKARKRRRMKNSEKYIDGAGI